MVLLVGLFLLTNDLTTVVQTNAQMAPRVPNMSGRYSCSQNMKGRAAPRCAVDFLARFAHCLTEIELTVDCEHSSGAVVTASVVRSDICRSV